MTDVSTLNVYDNGSLETLDLTSLLEADTFNVYNNSSLNSMPLTNMTCPDDYTLEGNDFTDDDRSSSVKSLPSRV